MRWRVKECSQGAPHEIQIHSAVLQATAGVNRRPAVAAGNQRQRRAGVRVHESQTTMSSVGEATPNQHVGNGDKKYA